MATDEERLIRTQGLAAGAQLKPWEALGEAGQMERIRVTLRLLARQCGLSLPAGYLGPEP